MLPACPPPGGHRVPSTRHSCPRTGPTGCSTPSSWARHKPACMGSPTAAGSGRTSVPSPPLPLHLLPRPLLVTAAAWVPRLQRRQAHSNKERRTLQGSPGSKTPSAMSAAASGAAGQTEAAACSRGPTLRLAIICGHAFCAGNEKRPRKKCIDGWLL